MEQLKHKRQSVASLKFRSLSNEARHITLIGKCTYQKKFFDRLKKHYGSYEPTLRQLKQKYELAMKEKMLTRLERDRAVGQVK